MATPWLIKGAIDSLKESTTANILAKYAGLIVGVVVVQAVFRYYWRRNLFGLSRKVEYDLRNDYFKHIQKLSPSFFLKTKTGDLMSRATNDMTAIREFLGLGSLIMVDAIVTVSASLSMMVVLNARLALITLIPMVIVSLLVLRFGKLIRKRYIAVQAQLAKISAMVQESISGIRVVQAYAQEGGERKRFDKLNKEYIDKNLDLVKVSGVLFPLLTFMSGISAAVALWIGGRDVIGNRMTLGSFVAFNGYLAMLTWPMMAVGFMTNLMQKGAASMTRIEEIMNAEPEIYDKPGSDARNMKPANWDIEFKGVGFTYPDAPAKSIDKIDIKINEGSVVGIVGEVGSGKSTLGRLISRNYDVTEGQITIGDIDIKDVPLKVLRDGVHYVEQDPFLFSETIHANIAFGENNGCSQPSGEGLLKEKTRASAIMAGLEKDLNSFPDNIDSRIGERGVMLSGGQKQRVALARALLRNSKILILDDSFSSLDTKTEDEIFKKIKNHIKDATTIFISHRISTVKDADIILVFNNGEIVERGSHQELIDLNGLYNKIYRNQILEMAVAG